MRPVLLTLASIASALRISPICRTTTIRCCLPPALRNADAVDIAIIGGGPCGLATAIALSKAPCLKDRTIAIYEKDGFKPKGASIQISSAGWQALKAMDLKVSKDIKATGTPVAGVRITSFTGEDRTPLPFKLVGGVIRFMRKFLRLRRLALTKTHLWHDVRDALRRRARDRLGNGALQSGHELTSLVEHPEHVALKFSASSIDGTSEARTVDVCAKIVLACDGTRSTVRALSPEPSRLLDEGKSVWRGIAETVDCDGQATFYQGDSGESGLIFPAGLGHGSSWTVIAPAVDGRSATNEDAQRRLAAALPDETDPPLLQVIAASPRIIENKLVTRDFSQPWTSDVARVAYLGDAAHPLRPTGEGTALAFEDAWTIGHLAATSAGLEPATLRKFEEARRKRVRAVSEAVKAAANRFYQSDSAISVTTPAAAMKAHPMRFQAL